MPRLAPWPCVRPTHTARRTLALHARTRPWAACQPRRAASRGPTTTCARRTISCPRCSARTRRSSPPSLPRRPRSPRPSTPSSARLDQGGRLIYVGAGSSGRLAALDAAECESTFSATPGQVVALVAGGIASPPLEQEAAEDDAAAGAADIGALEVGPDDAVVGDQRERPHPVRRRRARGGSRARSAHRRSRLGGRIRARARRRTRDRGRRRPRVHRGLDEAQGRDGAEARPQHDLDDLDDPAREDLREPDGRRRRDEREASGACPPNRRDGDRRLRRSRSTRHSRSPAGTRRSRSSRSSPASTRETARARLAAAGDNTRLALDGQPGS